jgi:hypothetical protein
MDVYPADDAVPALATLIAALEDTSMRRFYRAAALRRSVPGDECAHRRPCPGMGGDPPVVGYERRGVSALCDRGQSEHHASRNVPRYREEMPGARSGRHSPRSGRQQPGCRGEVVRRRQGCRTARSGGVACVSPRTLTRAARDFVGQAPAFAVTCGSAALHWMSTGYGRNHGQRCARRLRRAGRCGARDRHDTGRIEQAFAGPVCGEPREFVRHGRARASCDAMMSQCI